MNVANYLTLIRLLIGPLFLFFYLEYEELALSLDALPYLLLALVGGAELTDICDGYFARKYNEVTDLGKILDPMADSVYRLSLFLTFTRPPIELPLIFIFIFLYRDFFISTLRTLCALKGFALAARPSGKLKAIIQAAAACLVILLLIPYSLGHLSKENLQWISQVIVGFASGYTLLSAVDYFYAYRIYLKKWLVNPKRQNGLSLME